MGREHPIRDAGLAVSLLTVVPTPARMPESGGTQAAAWFAWVGAALGGVAYAIVKAAELWPDTRRSPLFVAALVVVVWALLTRLMHWDGLADVADAYWGSHERSRRLEILSDPHVGAFGAAALSLTAVFEVVAIATVLSAPHQSPVLVVPVFARFSATAAAWLGTPAREGGLGRSVMGRPTVLSALVAATALLGATWLLWTGLHVAGIAYAAIGLLLALGVPHVLALRFGGVTGDVMGASVLITETLLFALIAAVG